MNAKPVQYFDLPSCQHRNCFRNCLRGSRLVFHIRLAHRSYRWSCASGNMDQQGQCHHCGSRLQATMMTTLGHPDLSCYHPCLAAALLRRCSGKAQSSYHSDGVMQGLTLYQSTALVKTRRIGSSE